MRIKSPLRAIAAGFLLACVKVEWARPDSNRRTTNYEFAALPLSYRPGAKGYAPAPGSGSRGFGFYWPRPCTRADVKLRY